MAASNWRKYLVFSATALTMALAMSACARGFKEKSGVDMGKNGNAAVGAPTIPLGPTPATSASNPATPAPLLELAAANSPEIKKIVDDNRSNLNAITMTGSAGFAITELKADGSVSAENSVLYISVTVRSADGKATASTMLVSNEAQLALSRSNQGELTLSGYWKLNNPTQSTAPYYVGLASVVEAQGMDIKMRGHVIGINGEDLAQFDKSVCELVVDPMPWIPQFFGDYFPGCSTGEPAEQAEL